MKLSTRARYGLRAVLELARNYGQGPVKISTIAKCQDISVKYLEQLMNMLKLGGLVGSVRGAKGGYLLTRPPNEIKVSEVFLSLEGPIEPECISDTNACARASDCVTRKLWADVQKAVIDLLESMTVQDVLERSDKVKKNLDYTI